MTDSKKQKLKSVKLGMVIVMLRNLKDNPDPFLTPAQGRAYLAKLDRYAEIRKRNNS